MSQLCLPIDIEVLVLPEGRKVSQRYNFTRQPWHNGSHDVNTHLPPTGKPVQNKPFADQQLYLAAGLHLHFILPDPYFQATLDTATPEQQDLNTIPIPTHWWVIKENTEGKRLKTWVVESDYVHSPDALSEAVTLPVSRDLAPNTPPYRHIGRQIEIGNERNPLSMTPGEFLSDSKAATHYHQVNGSHLQSFLLGDMDYVLYYPNCYSMLGFHDAAFDLEKDKDTVYRVFGTYSSHSDPLMPGIISGIKRWLGKNVTDLGGEFKSICCFGGVSFDAEAEAIHQVKEVKVSLALGHTPAEAQLAHVSSLVNPEDRKRDKIQDRLQAAERVEELDLKSRDRVIALKRLIHNERFDKVLTPYKYAVRFKFPNGTDQQKNTSQRVPQEVLEALLVLNQSIEDHLKHKAALDSWRHQLFNDWHQYINLLYPPLAGHRTKVFADDIRQYLETHSLPAIQKLKEKEKRAASLITKQLKTLKAVIVDYAQYPLELIRLPDVSFQQPQNPNLSLVETEANTLILENSDRAAVSPKISKTIFESGPDDLNLPGEWQLPAHSSKWQHLNIRCWKQQDFVPLTLAWTVYLDPERPEPVKGYSLKETFPLKFMNKQYQLEDYYSFKRGRLMKGAYVPPTHTPGYYSGYSTLQKPDKRNLQKKIEALKVAPETYGVQDLVQYLEKLEQAIDQTNSLQVSLHGFNAACLMGQEQLELKIADPLGFAPYQEFSNRVAEAVGHEIRFSPLSRVPFNPFREGKLVVKELALISSFGLTRSLKWDRPQVLEEHKKSNSLWLSPGLAQPSRLRIKTRPKWKFPKNILGIDLQDIMDQLPGNTGEEGNPVFGYVSLDTLSRGLIVYNDQGQVQGRINIKGYWLPAGAESDSNKRLDNPHLHKWVSTLANPDLFPEWYQQLKRYFRERSIGQTHQHDFLQQGRPLALARLEIALELQGLPAMHQGLEQLHARIKRNQAPDTYTHQSGYSQVAFEIALGNEMAQQEGLVAIWPEGRFTTPGVQSTGSEDQVTPPFRFVRTADIFVQDHRGKKKKKHGDIGQISETRLSLQPGKNGTVFTCLFDPTRPITIQSGILPDLHWQLPENTYGPILRKLQPLFFSPYLITAEKGATEVPLPIQGQSQWSMLLPGDKSFRQELFEVPSLTEKGISRAFRELQIASEHHKDLKAVLLSSGLLTPLVARQRTFTGNRWVPEGQEKTKSLREALIRQCIDLEILQPLSAWHFELPLPEEVAEKKLEQLKKPFTSDWLAPVLSSLYDVETRPAGYRLVMNKNWTEEEAGQLTLYISGSNEQPTGHKIQNEGGMQSAALLTKALKQETQQLVTSPDLNKRPPSLGIQDGYLALNYQD